MVGCPGAETGVPVTGADGVLSPTTFSARTRTAYGVPLVRPLMRKLVPSVPVSVQLPDPSWYWYAMIAAPPLPAGANTTANDDGPAVTVVILGADGTVCAMPVATAEATPTPTAFTARNSTE